MTAQVAEANYRVEAILADPIELLSPIAYTSNIDDGKVVLSVLSEMSIVAASLLWPDTARAQLVIAGEHTFNSDNPSTGELMAKQACLHGVSQDHITVIDDSKTHLNNTTLQMRALKGYVDAHGSDASTVLLGHDFHNQRLRMHAEAYGLKAQTLSIADVLIAYGVASEYPELEHLKAFEKHREQFLRAWARFDSKGRMLNLLTSIGGPHVHDISKNSKGIYETTSMSARSRVKQLG